jgi:hypothetical protein
VARLAAAAAAGRGERLQPRSLAIEQAAGLPPLRLAPDGA